MNTNLHKQLRALGLLGLAARVDEVANEPWLEKVIQIERAERQTRGLDWRLKKRRLGHCKAIADDDWSRPKSLDREAIEELFQLAFVRQGANVVLVGRNGVG